MGFSRSHSGLFPSHGRAKTTIANETSSAAIGNGPKVPGQISMIITVPIMIPTPDQKKAALIVDIAIEYKSSSLNCYCFPKDRLEIIHW